MKAKRSLSVFITILGVLFFSGLSWADSESMSPFKLAYTCVPVKIWDAGYHVRIVFNVVSRQFEAWTSETSIFGETQIFSDPVALTIKTKFPGAPRLYTFRQITPTPVHSFTLNDFGHHAFRMSLTINGERVDQRLEILNCNIESWFLKQYP